MVDEPGLVIARAAALVAAGRHPDALSLVAPHLAGGDLGAYLVAAKAELELKNYDDAERLARAAVSMAPADLGALQAMAEVLLERRRRKDSQGVLTTMIALAPHSSIPSSLWVLGDMKAGVLDDGTEMHARRAVALNPANTAAAQVLALVLFQRGGRRRTAEAKSLTAMAATLDPATELTALTIAESAEKHRNMIPTIRYGAGKLRSNPTRASLTLVFGLLRTLSIAFSAQLLLGIAAHRFGRGGAGTSDSIGFAGSVTMAIAAVAVLLVGSGFVHRLGSDRRLVLTVVRRSRPLLGAAALQGVALGLELGMLLATPMVAADLLLGIVLVTAGGVGICVVTIRYYRISSTSQR